MDLKILVNYDIVSSYAYGSFSIVLSLPIIVSILHFVTSHGHTEVWIRSSVFIIVRTES